MKRVLDVGNCGFDHQSICQYLQNNWEVQVDRATTLDDATRAVERVHYDLVLINRIFDGDGTSGLRLIEQFANEVTGRPIPAVLLTNFPDVQAEAIQAGAVGSFGKRELGSEATRQLLASILSTDRTSA